MKLTTINQISDAFRNVRLSTQLTAAIILMTLITVTATTIVLSRGFYRSIYQNAVSSHQRLNKQLTADVDESILKIEQHYNSLISNRLIFRNLQNEDFGKFNDSYEGVIYFKELMFSLISSTEGLHSSFYISKDGTMISSQSGVIYPGVLRKDEVMIHPAVDRIYSHPEKAVWYTANIAESGYIFYMRGVRNPANGEVLGIITFVIKPEMFQHHLTELMAEQFNIYICSETGDSFISSNNDESFDDDIFNVIEEQGYSKVVSWTDRFLIGSHNINSWTIITEIKKNDLVQSGNIFFEGIITVLICVLISVFLIFHVVRRYTNDLTALAAVMRTPDAGQLDQINIQCRSLESKTLVTSYNQMISNMRTLNNNLIEEMRQKNLAEQKSENLQGLWDNMFENSAEGITITDSEGKIERINKRFTSITGYEFEEVAGKSTSVLKSDRHDNKFYDNMWKSLNEKGKWSGEIWNRRKSGEAYPEWLGITSFTEKATGRLMYFAVFHDISDKIQQEEKLEWMTNYDALTKLPMRHIFLNKMQTEFKAAIRNDEICAFLVMNIDGLKKINYSYGANVGDSVLQEISSRLKSTMRDEDHVSRFGGDEFAILVPRIKDREKIYPIIKRMQKLMIQPVVINDKTIELTTSLGVSLFPQDSSDTQDIIAKAGLALSRTKNKRRGSYSMFDSKFDDILTANSNIEINLRKAITLGEFEVHYQPKINAILQEVVGFEALLRWKNKENGWIPPYKFIPIAEDTGMIVEIGYFVITEACKFLTRLKSEGWDNIPIGINVSARQFAEPDFIDNLIKILEIYDVSPTEMDLEITESITASEVYNAIDSLTRLSNSGFTISIDDFGTGYSSLKYLVSLPFDTIKIDKSFVDTVLSEDNGNTVLNSMISLAHSLKKKLVAEGVETKEQLDYLVNENCPVIQGYYFSKPISSNEIIEYLESESYRYR